MGQHDPKDCQGKTEPEKPRDAKHDKRADAAVVVCLGAALLLIQAGLIFGVLPAGAIGAEPSKSNWWPTKQYSWTDAILAVTTFALLLATIAYAVVSFRQWGVLRETLEETRRANNMTLRAWLLVEKIEVRRLSTVEPGSFIDRPIRVTVRNYGKLPALSVSRFFELIPPKSGWPRQPPKATGTGNRAIAAGESHTFPLPVDVLSAEEIAEREQHQGVLFLTVRFTYTDALGETKGDSSYCWFYSHAEDGSPKFVDFPMSGFGVS